MANTSSGPRLLLPTELSLHRALAIARWGSWLWTAGVVVFAGDDLEHPVAAGLCVAAAFAVVAIVEGRSRFEGDDPDNAANHTIRRILTSFR